MNIGVVPEAETSFGYDGTTALDLPLDVPCDDRSTTQPRSGTHVYCVYCVCIVVCIPLSYLISLKIIA